MPTNSTAKQQYETAKAQRQEAEQVVRAAERVMSGHPAKLETKRRQLRNISNTMSHSDMEQNDRSNRHSNKADIEKDISTLEQEIKQAEETLKIARGELAQARAAETQATNTIAVEKDQTVIDNSNRQIALDEKKFALAEKQQADAAEAKLAEAKINGATAKEIELLKAKAAGAMAQFEWASRQEMQAAEAASRQQEMQLGGQISERASILGHQQGLETIEANTVADLARIGANGKEHRANVTHETNERIREAIEMLGITMQKGAFDTLNTAKLLLLKHLLRKDEMSHALKIAQDAKQDELENVADDMAIISKWREQQSDDDNFEQNS